jgi:hypothetical protein
MGQLKLEVEERHATPMSHVIVPRSEELGGRRSGRAAEHSPQGQANEGALGHLAARSRASAERSGPRISPTESRRARLALPCALAAPTPQTT